MTPPNVAATNTGQNSTASTSHTVNLPDGSNNVGHLLKVHFTWGATGQTNPLSWPSGWTQYYWVEQTAGGNEGCAGAYRQVDGSEGYPATGATITVGTAVSTKSAHVSYRITGHENPATQAPQAATAIGTNAPADPPNLAPTGGAKDYLWLALGANSETTLYTGGDSNYSNLITVGTTGGGATINTVAGGMQRQFNAASQNPAAYTGPPATSEWVGVTVAIHPMSGIAPDFIASTTTVYAPVVSGTITPDAIASITTVYAPTVGLQGITPDTIASTTTVYAPIVSGTITPDAIASTSAVYAPIVSGTIAPDAIASITTVYAPTVSGTIAPDAIASITTVYAPTVSGTIAPDAIASITTVYAPTVGLQGITPDAIASTTTVYAPTVSGTITPNGIASTTTVYAPTVGQSIAPATITSTTAVYGVILLRDDDETTIVDAWAGPKCKPLVRIVAGEGADTCSIAEADVLLYEEHTANRLGAVDLQLKINNASGVYTSSLGATLAPGVRAWFSLGARVAGVEYLRRRHAATIVTVTPSDFSTHPDFITIVARNNWHLLESVLAENLAYNSYTIADAIDELSDLASVNVTRAAANLWAFQLADFTARAGAPIASAINQLIGEVPNAQAVALGYFDPGGHWYLAGLSANPASDYALPVSQVANIAYHDDVISRFQISGADDAQAAELPDLISIVENYRIYSIDIIGSTALTDRLAQEAMQQRELWRHGYVELQPDPRFHLWHVVTVTNCAHVADNTKMRIDFITLTYRPGDFTMKIGIRIAALIATYTALALLPTPTVPVVLDTIRDNFDTYGGEEIAQNSSAGLHWLQLIQAEAGATDESLTGDASLSASYAAQGNTSANLGTTGKIMRYPAAPINLDLEGRFTDEDFVVVTLHATIANAGTLTFYESPFSEAYMSLTTAGTGRYFFAVKRKNLVDVNVPDWTNIEQIYAYKPGAYVDDVRIVKADPDDPTTFNDTGRAWDFSSGIWHIYQDAPNIPYALGQIDTRSPGTRYTALDTRRYTARNHYAAGVYLREDGAAGLLAFMVDPDNGYELKLDTSANTLKLLKWINGVSTELASVAYTSAPNTIYYLALMREGRYLSGFVSDGTTPVFGNQALKLYVADQKFHAGRVGLTAYGVNTRFFQVRAGSPEHALTSEYAYATQPRGHQHATGSDWTLATGTASRATFDTTTVTLEELAKRVKALLDDLHGDTLIQ